MDLNNEELKLQEEIMNNYEKNKPILDEQAKLNERRERVRINKLTNLKKRLKQVGVISSFVGLPILSFVGVEGLIKTFDTEPIVKDEPNDKSDYNKILNEIPSVPIEEADVRVIRKWADVAFSSYLEEHHIKDSQGTYVYEDYKNLVSACDEYVENEENNRSIVNTHTNSKDKIMEYSATFQGSTQRFFDFSIFSKAFVEDETIYLPDVQSTIQGMLPDECRFRKIGEHYFIYSPYGYNQEEEKTLH